MSRLSDHSGLEPMFRDECLRHLGEVPVGRLAVGGAGSVDVFPVNFVLDGECIVFRTAEGTKFDEGERSAVAFEVDEIDAVHHGGWSVVVHGWLEELSAHAAAEITVRTDLRPWAPGAKPHVMRLHPTSITGRRLPDQRTRQD